MKNLGQTTLYTIVLSAFLSAATMVAAAQQPAPQSGASEQKSPQTSPTTRQTSPPAGAVQSGETDNTRMNQRDREEPRVTADQQTETEADRKLSASIRKSITDDKSLSTYAHNVKIISQNGAVTLKGPVRTDAEKKAIEAAAKKVAGDANVKSEITVEPESR